MSALCKAFGSFNIHFLSSASGLALLKVRFSTAAREPCSEVRQEQSLVHAGIVMVAYTVCASAGVTAYLPHRQLHCATATCSNPAQSTDKLLSVRK